jgi:hypothetical protein
MAGLSRLGGSIQLPVGQRPHPVNRYPIAQDCTIVKIAVNKRFLALNTRLSAKRKSHCRKLAKIAILRQWRPA